MAHGLSCSMACGIFPDQGSNPSPLHWQVDSFFFFFLAGGFLTTVPPGKSKKDTLKSKSRKKDSPGNHSKSEETKERGKYTQVGPGPGK